MTSDHYIKVIVCTVLSVILGTLGLNAREEVDSVLCHIAEGDICDVDIRVRCNGKLWNLIWDYTNEDNYKAAEIKRESADFDSEDYGYISSVRLLSVTNGEENTKSVKQVRHYDPECSLYIRRDGLLTNISAGDGQRIWSGLEGLAFTGQPNTKVILRSNKPLKNLSINPRITYCIGGSDYRFANKEELEAYLASSTDSIEGLWEFMERDISHPGVKLGGSYKLALIRDGKDYDVLFWDGCDAFRELWKPLYRKGRLTATRYLDHFDLEWIPASRDIELNGEMWANFEVEKTVIAFHMPLLKAVLKFRKI